MGYIEDKKAVGQGGTVCISDTNAHTGLDLWMVEVVEEATFTTLTAPDCEGVTGTAWPAGTRIASGAGITAVTLSGGKVVGYKN